MKSLFLAPTSLERAKAARIDELNKFFHDNKSVNGAFCDKEGAIGRLAHRVRRSMGERIKRPEKVLMDALFDSDPPFLVDDVCYDGLRTAGAIACTSPRSIDGLNARIVDKEEITLLSVAVLRILGERAMFGLTVGPENEGYFPLIILLRDKECMLMQVSNTHIPLPDNAIIEVLGDSAVHSLVHFNNAISMNVTLHNDMEQREPIVPGEWQLRAIALAHKLYEAAAMWSVAETERDIGISRALFGIRKNIDVTGLRHALEHNLIRNLANAFPNLVKDIAEEYDGLGEFAKAYMGKEHLLAHLIEHIGQEMDEDDSREIARKLQISGMLHFHIHNPLECDYLKRVLS